MVNLIGDSSAGKTLFALSCLSEAARLEAFNGYRFIMDDIENALDFNIEYLFGSQVEERMEPPAYDEEGTPLPSDDVEDFHVNILDALDYGQPFIYIVDSWDALDSEEDKKKVDEFRTAKKKGTKTKGSYGMAKPKKASQILRNTCARLKRTGSVLIIISQTRDDIDPMTRSTKTRSGGRALKFYAHHEIWLSMIGKIPYRERVIGNKVRAVISKNKITGKVREADFPIYYDYGVDDIQSCIDFLVKEGRWPKTKMTINAEADLGVKGTKAKLVSEIEGRGLERKLRRATGVEWAEIEESLKLNRKPKYA